jgi:hypothetical protein
LNPSPRRSIDFITRGAHSVEAIRRFGATILLGMHKLEDSEAVGVPFYERDFEEEALGEG